MFPFVDAQLRQHVCCEEHGNLCKYLVWLSINDVLFLWWIVELLLTLLNTFNIVPELQHLVRYRRYLLHALCGF